MKNLNWNEITQLVFKIRKQHSILCKFPMLSSSIYIMKICYCLKICITKSPVINHHINFTFKMGSNRRKSKTSRLIAIFATTQFYCFTHTQITMLSKWTRRTPLLEPNLWTSFSNLHERLTQLHFELETCSEQKKVYKRRFWLHVEEDHYKCMCRLFDDVHVTNKVNWTYDIFSINCCHPQENWNTIPPTNGQVRGL